MEPFKNMISLSVAEQIARAIRKNYKEFNSKKFLAGLESELKPLELKQRVEVIARRLHENLSDDLDFNLEVIEGVSGLSGFTVWPLTHYVAVYGLDSFDRSLDCLKELTKVFTSEFAIRPFIIADEKRVMKKLKEWVHDESEHVRRLVSEGTRPLLPWGQKLIQYVADPARTWPLLRILCDDSSLYVRKSVANHLNDHSKNHPDFVLTKLLELKNARKCTKEHAWIISHASRTLIKKGHPGAFLLHDIEASHIKLHAQKVHTKKVSLGEALSVEVTVENTSGEKQRFILDHEVHLLKANAKHNIKCFKGLKSTLLPFEKKTLTLKVPLKPVTTRTYYSGQHFWNCKLNGVSFKKLAFTLET